MIVIDNALKIAVAISFSFLSNGAKALADQPLNASQLVIYEYKAPAIIPFQLRDSNGQAIADKQLADQQQVEHKIFSLKFKSKLSEYGTRHNKWSFSVLENAESKGSVQNTAQSDEITQFDIIDTLDNHDPLYWVRLSDNLILKMHSLGFSVEKLTVHARGNNVHSKNLSEYEIDILAIPANEKNELGASVNLNAEKSGQQEKSEKTPDDYDSNVFEMLIDYILRPIKILTHI
jgi:hypothetical protein